MLEKQTENKPKGVWPDCERLIYIGEALTYTSSPTEVNGTTCVNNCSPVAVRDPQSGPKRQYISWENTHSTKLNDIFYLFLQV